MQYFQTLIWTMLFVVFVEMLFPPSDLKKYLKLVLSFIVIYMVCSPLVQGLSYLNKEETQTLGDYIQMYQQQLGQGIVDKGRKDPGGIKNYEMEMKKQQKGMIDIYQDQISNQVKQLIQYNLPIEVLEVETKAVVDENVFEIEELTLEVTYKNHEETIGVGIGNKDESMTLDEEILKKEIKNVLNDFYNWDNTNIYITVQAN